MKVEEGDGRKAGAKSRFPRFPGRVVIERRQFSTKGVATLVAVHTPTFQREQDLAHVVILTVSIKRSILLMTNQDKTLSLHQPWASLLVHGIKRIEGRNWSTNFRGNLWIHATARRPEQELIKQYEDLYRSIFDMEGHEVAFPETYPTGVLVGRVKIVDCLSGSDVSSSFTIPDYLKFEVERNAVEIDRRES